VGAMLRAAGFCNIQTIGHEIYACQVSEPMPPMAVSELQSVLQSKQ